MTEKNYNGLYKDFQILYDLEKDAEQFDNLCPDCTKELVDEFLKQGKDPDEIIVSYYKQKVKIVEKLGRINPFWTKKYKMYKFKYPRTYVHPPKIYMLFHDLVESIKNEEFEMSAKIRKEIYDNW